MAGSEATQFQPGQSGNPGGRVRTAAVSELARRYTVDAIRALVAVARMPTYGQHVGAKVSAARTLIEIGYPGLAKGGLENALASVAQLHLLAVQQIVPADQNSVLNDPGDAEDAALLAFAERPGMLAAPEIEPPETALPLWDAYRVHRTSPSPPTDDANQGWEPLPWENKQGDDTKP